MQGCYRPPLLRHSGVHFLSLLLFTTSGLASQANDTLIMQQQRQKALEQQATPSPADVRLSAPTSAAG